MKYIYVIGPFPPPVHGMAKNLKLMHDDLMKINENVIGLDISPRSLNRGVGYHLKKIHKVSLALFRLFKGILKKEVKAVYMPPDGGLGLFYSMLFFLLSSLSSSNIFLHHRSFAYINRYNKFMKVISKFNRRNTHHIFLCDCMAAKFQVTYGEVSNYRVVSNATYVTLNSINRLSDDKVIRLGFMSNIGYEKGISRFIELVNSINSKNFKVHGVIAGPFESPEVEKDIRFTLANNSTLSYVGPVYGDAKTNFFSTIDVFVFPTFYRNEAQPNVLFEAMSFANLIVSTNIACIAEDLNESFAVISNADDNWVEETANSLLNIFKNQKKFDLMRSNTFQMIRDKKLLADKAYKKLVHDILDS